MGCSPWFSPVVRELQVLSRLCAAISCDSRVKGQGTETQPLVWVRKETNPQRDLFKEGLSSLIQLYHMCCLKELGPGEL